MRVLNLLKNVLIVFLFKCCAKHRFSALGNWNLNEPKGQPKDAKHLHLQSIFY